MAHTRVVRAPGSPRRGLAAALGGWSALHRKTAIGLWLLFVIAATVLGGAAGRAGLSGWRQGAGDSARAEHILANAKISEPATELVLVRSGSRRQPRRRRHSGTRWAGRWPKSTAQVWPGKFRIPMPAICFPPMAGTR